MENFEIKDGVAIIPEGTEHIGNKAFYECKGLTSVEIAMCSSILLICYMVKFGML